MTRWPARLRPAVETEPPAWVRVFDPEAWRSPDARELAMGGAAHHPGWREWHAWRRWMEAVRAW